MFFIHARDIWDDRQLQKNNFCLIYRLQWQNTCISRRMSKIPKPHLFCKKLVHASHNEKKILIAEYIVYFIFDLRNIRKKITHGTFISRMYPLYNTAYFKLWKCWCSSLGVILSFKAINYIYLSSRCMLFPLASFTHAKQFMVRLQFMFWNIYFKTAINHALLSSDFKGRLAVSLGFASPVIQQR